MDLYSVSQATSFGNQVGQGVNSENRFRQAQNSLVTQQALKAAGDAKSGESVDIAEKFGGDATSLAETPGSISTIARLSKSEGLIAKQVLCLELLTVSEKVLLLYFPRVLGQEDL